MGEISFRVALSQTTVNNQKVCGYQSTGTTLALSRFSPI